MKRLYVRWTLVDDIHKFFLVREPQHTADVKFAVLGRTFNTLAELHAYRQGLEDAIESHLWRVDLNINPNDR